MQMKDASSIPQGYNPNYEERRKPFTPAKHRKGQPTPEKPATRKTHGTGDGSDVPAKERGNEQDAASNPTRKAPDA